MNTEVIEMKRRTLLITLLTLSLMAAGYGLVQAHGGYDSGWGHMMGGYGYGHMIGYGNNGCWNAPERSVLGEITPEKAEEIVTFNLSRTNDRLKVGKVIETEDGFEVQVVTKKGEALVDRLLVERDTGRFYRIYR
jgi:hypothetical protein